MHIFQIEIIHRVLHSHFYFRKIYITFYFNIYRNKSRSFSCNLRRSIISHVSLYIVYIIGCLLNESVVSLNRIIKFGKETTFFILILFSSSVYHKSFLVFLVFIEPQGRSCYISCFSICTRVIYRLCEYL